MPARIGIVQSNLPITPEVVLIEMRPEESEGLIFRAGQYIEIEIEPGLSRPYSIASPPSRPRSIQLCLNRVPQGSVSTRLAAIRERDRIVYTGPHGRFTLPDDPADELLFVATGTGIAPIRSMILDCLERRVAARIDLLFGTRRVSDLLFEQEFRGLELLHPHFRYHITISRPGEDRWDGLRGRVTKILPKVFSSLTGREAFVCGRPEMVEEMMQLLASLGVEQAWCHREE